MLFIVALRHIGTARAGAYFSIAPFFGAILAIAMGDPVTIPLIVAGLLMALGVWLHLTERHEHPHTHVPPSHTSTGTRTPTSTTTTTHAEPVAAGTRHRHAHEHAELTHTHEHYPDGHHRHPHG